jgi:signal transduction histidine kinase
MNTQHGKIERVDDNQILTKYLCNFVNPFLEENFFKLNFTSIFMSKIFALISLMLSFINIIILLTITHNEQQKSNYIMTILLFGMTLLIMISSFIPLKLNNFFISVYLQFILFSSNIIELGYQVMYVYYEGDVNLNKNVFLTILIFTLSLDSIFKLLWTFCRLNNFKYFLFSNFGSLILNFTILNIDFPINVNIDFLMLIPYAIFLLLLNFFSREAMKIKKIHSYYFSKKYSVHENFINSINCGYVKIKNNSLIESNNFFEREEEIFKKFLDEKNILRFGAELDMKKTILTENLKNEENLEILKIIISNVKYVNENLQNYPMFSRTLTTCFSTTINNVATRQENFSQLEKDKNEYSKIPDVSINHLDLNLTKDLFETSNIQSKVTRKITKSNTTNFSLGVSKDLFELILSQKKNFKFFQYLGKSVLIKSSDQILSLEIFVRVDEEDCIELILNDVSKSDFYNGSKQFMIKTGQFLHDFKNPILCITNEISELREEIEIIMGMIIKNNENVDRNSKADDGSFQPILAEKIDYNIKDCMNLLWKFEYIKQMSEYCQSMIGSYEDFSKGTFNSKMKINLSTLDLLSLLDFIKNMMSFKLLHSNKDVIFDLKIDNLFKEEIDGDKKSKFFNSKNQIIDSNYLQDKKYLIKTDEEKLKRVLINILSNSEKFTTSGSITLCVETEIINEKRYIKFSIQDTGIGMDNSDLQKLFTPFFSNNNSELNKNGCGLGLIIVKEITENLGLGMKVSSEIGKGTLSTIYIEDHNFDLGLSRIQKKKSTKKTNFDKNSIFRKINTFKDDDTLLNQQMEIINKDKFNSLIKFLENENFQNSDIFFDNSMTSYSRYVNNTFVEKKNLLKKLSKKRVNDFSQGMRRNEKHKTTPKLNVEMKDFKSNDNIHRKFESSIKICNTITLNSSLICEKPKKFANLTLSIISEINLEIKSNQINRKLFRQITSNQINSKENQENFYRRRGSNHTLNLFEHQDTLGKNESDTLDKQEEIIPVIKETQTFTFKSQKENIMQSTISSFKQVLQKGNLHKNNSIKSQPQEDLGTQNSVFVDAPNIENNSKTIKILLIDNEYSIRSFCKSLFKKMKVKENIKFQVEEAEDGFSGLSRIFNKFITLKDNYDYIITDDIMDYLDGTEMVKFLSDIIQKNGSKCQIFNDILKKIIICSSDTENVKYKLKSFKEVRVWEKPLNYSAISTLV